MIVRTCHVEWSYVTYDLVVIGSGPGGYSAAVRAGQYGLKTAIVEKDNKLGGVCLHVGCIPTKALLHTAEMWHFATHAEEEGIGIEKPVLNYPKAVERKAAIVTKHAKGVEFLMKKNKVEVVSGYATIKGPGKVEVKGPKGEVKVLETKNILIATGSEARMLPGLKPDPEFILTNIEILNLTQVPKSLMVIGSGAVGSEFASMFVRLGSDVSLFEMLPRIVPAEDEEVSKELERVFKKQKIRMSLRSQSPQRSRYDRNYHQWQSQDACIQRQAERCPDQGFRGILPLTREVTAATSLCGNQLTATRKAHQPGAV